MIPRIKIRQWTTSTEQTIPRLGFHTCGARHKRFRRPSDSTILERASAKIKDLDIPFEAKMRRKALRKSRHGRADLMARLAIAMDMRVQRLRSRPPSLRLHSDLDMLVRYVSDWIYGMALHIAEDPASTGPKMRSALRETFKSAQQRMDEIINANQANRAEQVVLVKKKKNEVVRGLNFLSLIENQERMDTSKTGLPASMQAWAKRVAASFERAHALEDQEQTVENGCSSFQPTNPDNVSLSESHKPQGLAMHKPEYLDSEQASLDIATLSQAVEIEEPAVEDRLDNSNDEPATKRDSEAATPHEAPKDSI
jgi:hypothetical protein